MTYQILSYLRFLWRSTNQHGVHSPFVYKLVTECFYDKKRYSEYSILRNHRKELIKDPELIHVRDFGAGSKVFRSDVRKVSDIAKTAGIRKKRQQLLFRLVRYLQPTSILELGTSMGISTMAMALASAEATIRTVEGCSNTANKARELFEKFKIQNVAIHLSDFDTFLSEDDSKFDLIYLDGNHSKDATISIFKRLLSKVQNDSVIIFDDIYWSREMTEAWEIIVAHPEVTVSIDTFQWGIVFFRKEQVKEHFEIRV